MCFLLERKKEIERNARSRSLSYVSRRPLCVTARPPVLLISRLRTGIDGESPRSQDRISHLPNLRAKCSDNCNELRNVAHGV